MKYLNKNTLFILVAMYTILPTYFRIGGINSQIFLAGIIIIIYLLLPNRKKLRKLPLVYCLIFFVPYMISVIAHFEFPALLRRFLELVVIVLIVTDCVRTDKDIVTLMSYIVYLSGFEAVTALFHSVFDFNLFSLLSNTTDRHFINSDYGAGTQYRLGLPRVEGSFSHAITFGMYLSICAILCLYLYNKTKRKKYLFCYVFDFIGVFLTISRMPIIVFCISQIAVLFRLNHKKTIKILLGVFLGGAFGAIALVAFFPGTWKAISGVFSMVLSVFNLESLKGIGRFSQESAFSYRSEMVRAILPTIRNNLLIGMGGEKMSGFKFLINGTIQTSIDNQYLYYLAQYGFMGLFFTILWFMQLFVFQRKKKEKAHEDKKSFTFYRNLIIFVYAVNLISVAMMEEYKLITVFISLSLSEILLNKDKYKIPSIYHISRTKN